MSYAHSLILICSQTIQKYLKEIRRGPLAETHHDLQSIPTPSRIVEPTFEPIRPRSASAEKGTKIWYDERSSTAATTTLPPTFPQVVVPTMVSTPVPPSATKPHSLWLMERNTMTGGLQNPSPPLWLSHIQPLPSPSSPAIRTQTPMGSVNTMTRVAGQRTVVTPCDSCRGFGAECGGGLPCRRCQDFLQCCSYTRERPQ